MSTDLDPTQLAIEFLRRDKTELSPAQYLKRLKQLELEFADLLTLSSPSPHPLLTLSATELKEEIYFAWRLGVH
ncbi:TPA: YdiH family protein [Salmonella enterica subsp. enterica serovar Nagoya]